MHSLQSIHNINTQQAIHENNRLTIQAIAQGKGVLHRLDAVTRRPDPALTPTIFPSQADAKEYLQRRVPAIDHHLYSIA
jgi:hypothetical protein